MSTPIHFCHPGKPWQRPSKEHTNGLRRDYLPKGTNLRRFTEQDLQRVGDELNRRPRKARQWDTLHDPFNALKEPSA